MTDSEVRSTGRRPIARPTLAVIIPTLNEAASIANTLASIANQSDPAERIIVVDGGSTDDTVSLAAQSKATVLLGSPLGRGRQIASAVEHVDEEIVLIGHADMEFPPGAFAGLREFLTARPNCPGGCLGHRFDRRGLGSRLVEAWDFFRAKWFGVSYGDQAQFVRRAALDRIGGFPDQPIMEDLELSRRLRGVGRPAYLGLLVTVSARRFERLGFLRTVWTNLKLRAAYRRGGVDVCREIHARYHAKRS